MHMDFVAKHTSSEHKWFREARKSRHNPYLPNGKYLFGNGKERKPNVNYAPFETAVYKVIMIY